MWRTALIKSLSPLAQFCGKVKMCSPYCPLSRIPEQLPLFPQRSFLCLTPKKELHIWLVAQYLHVSKFSCLLDGFTLVEGWSLQKKWKYARFWLCVNWYWPMKCPSALLADVVLLVLWPVPIVSSSVMLCHPYCFPFQCSHLYYSSLVCLLGEHIQHLISHTPPKHRQHFHMSSAIAVGSQSCVALLILVESSPALTEIICKNYTVFHKSWFSLNS